MINKKKLLKYCQSQMAEKIAIARKNMEEAQLTANTETKSSAGDKYETGRTMGHHQRDLYAWQLSEIMNMRKMFSSINPDKKCVKVELGAVVQTSSATFFLSAGMGQMEVEGYKIMVISAISPVAQVMLDKEEGEKFLWVKKEVEIKSIE